MGEKAIEETEREKLGTSGPELEGDDQLGPPLTKRPRGRPKKDSLTTPTPTANDESVQSPSKRPRGRPRKRPLPVQPATQASSIDVPVATNDASQQPAKRPRGGPRKYPPPVSSCSSSPTTINLQMLMSKIQSYDIYDEMGSKYRECCTFLLNDRDGAKLQAIEGRYQRDASSINHEIFSRWLQGEGRQPVTWATLVGVLQDIGMKSLADDIKVGDSATPPGKVFKPQHIMYIQ